MLKVRASVPRSRRKDGEAGLTRPALPAVVGLACLTLLAGVAERAPAADSLPEAREILRRALDLHEGVRDYTASVRVEADAKGAPAEVPAFKVFFKRPDKVRIKSRSLVIVPRDMLMFGNLSKLIEEGADVLLLGTKTVGGTPMHTLKLVPKEPEAGGAPVRILITVDGTRWTVDHSRIIDGSKERATFEWSYVLVGSKYWMPSTIRMTVPQAARRDGALGAEMVVTFSEYQVNTGLSDSLFEESGG